MPALSFLAIVGLAVITLLFVAKATPELGSPEIVASQHTAAPAPDKTPRPVLATQPQSAPVPGAKIPSAARVTRAEAPPRNKRVMRSKSYQAASFGRFSIKGY